MRRIVILIIAGALAAFAILYALRLAEKSPSAGVALLLPRETIAFAHLPDFKRTRSQWHQLDIYQLYAEPRVQEFLRKPLAKLPTREATARTMQEIEQLDPRDAFLALTKIDNNNPAVLGGFRFRSGESSTEKVIESWRARLLGPNPAGKREKVPYEKHQIDLFTVPPFTLATAFAGEWFLVSNDLGELKAALDRADHHGKDRQSTLGADKNYRAAMLHLPSGYAVSFYLQPKIFADKLSALRAADTRHVPPDQRTMLEQMRAICGATRFEHGKIHDIFFLGMPKLDDAKLTQSSLALGTKDTFLYLAMLLNLGEKFNALGQTPGVTPLVSGWQKTLQMFAASGVTAEEWKSAFGVELGALADWPATARWPWCFVTFSVQDVTKADKIIEALVKSNSAGVWTRTEKDGVRYFSMSSAASLVAISPTIALSDQYLIAGLDPISVEEAMKRYGAGRSELANSATYDNAAHSVAPPTNFFAYVDLPLLYSRLDAILRPMLILSSGFLPGLAEYVDLSKWPAAEIVTKHLSPIASSQRYDGDGYVAESTGSITLNQSGLGLAVLGALAYQGGGAPNLGVINAAASPTPRPKPTQPLPAPGKTP